MPFSATRDLWLVLKAQNMASGAMRGFSRDIRMVGDSVRMANLQASRAQLINQMATQRLTGASAADLLVTQRRIQAIDREIGSMRVARAAMEEQRVSAQRLGSALSGAAGMMGALGTASTAIGIFGAMGLKNLVDSALDYQKQASLTRTQVDKFATSLSDIEEIGLRVARTIGVPFAQIQPALFDIFSSMEVGAKDAEALLKTFAKAAVAGQTDIQSAARATIGILNAFQLPLSTVNHLMDLQFQLVQEGIGTYEEWTARIGLVTPSAVRAGQSVETMLAALAATTRFGISAARSGTAVARAFDALSNPKSVQALKELGVEALDAEGNFRPLFNILGDFRAVLDKMDKGQAEKIAVILDVFKGAGGTIEARRFLQNMLLTPGNLELFKSILDEMTQESGSFEKAYGIMADSVAIRTELMKNQWEAVKIAAGTALLPTFEKIVGFLSRMFEWFNKLTPRQQEMITTALAIGVALATVLGIVLLMTAGFLGFAAAIAIAGTEMLIVLGVLAGIGAAFTAFVAAVVLAWQNSHNFRGIIRDMIPVLKEFWQDTVLPAAKAIKDAWEKDLTPAFAKLADIVEYRLMPVVRLLTAFFTAELMKSVSDVSGKIKNTFIWIIERAAEVINNFIIPAIRLLTDYYHEHEDAIKKIVTVLIFLGKWFTIIAAIILGVLVVVIIGPLVAAFSAIILVVGVVIHIIVTLIEWIREVIKWFKNLIEDIKATFTVKTLENVGKQMIDGFINGIKNGFDGVKETITNLGKSALKWLGEAIGASSPSKEFMKLGQFSMEGYILGIKKAMPALEAQTVSTTAGLTSAVAGGNNTGGGGGGVTQTFTIHTQEIEPRRHAAELGYLLSGRS